MLRIILLYALLITLLVTGCGSSATLQPLKTPEAGLPATSLSALAGDWTIKMTHSGGFMGLSRSIEISSDGKYTVMDDRTKKTINGEFPADQLSKINGLISSSKYTPASEPDGASCADCFIYDLEIRRGGEKLVIQLNDISLPNSGLEALVTELRSMIETALK